MKFHSILVADYVTVAAGGPVIVGLKRQLNLDPAYLGQAFSFHLWIEYRIEEADIGRAETVEIRVAGDAVAEARDARAIVPAAPADVFPQGFWEIERSIGIPYAVGGVQLVRAGTMEVTTSRGGERDGSVVLPVSLISGTLGRPLLRIQDE